MGTRTNALETRKVVTDPGRGPCGRPRRRHEGHARRRQRQRERLWRRERLHRARRKPIELGLNADDAGRHEPRRAQARSLADEPGDQARHNRCQVHDKPGAEKPGADKANAANANAEKAESTIRVEVGRLEALMNLVGELVLQKNRIAALTHRMGVSEVDHDMTEAMGLAASGLDRVTGDIQLAVMRTRMQPLDKLFGKYTPDPRPRQKTGKKMQLVVEGGETEVDKSVLEALGDPLVHLLRNSADHGIDTPEERAKAGKPEFGTILLRAGHEGKTACRMVVSDDGRGLSRRAHPPRRPSSTGWSPPTIAAMSDREVYRFIFEAGFSTADKVSDLSRA